MIARCLIYAGALLCLAGSFEASAPAQDPTLQRRKAASPDDQIKTITEVKAPLNIPTDAGGEYVFGKPGEFIEIIFEAGVLHGYMSRVSDAENDRGAPLTYYFSRTTVDGTRIRFKTYLIHGAWYSFEGTIVQGSAKSLAEDGFYRLVGSLVLHDEGTNSEQHRNLNLKLSRRM